MAKGRPALDELQQRLGYRFGDEQDLIAALTHSSAVGIAGPHASERLEFLGDAVLGLAFADLLIQRYPDLDEGQLSKFRAALVCTASFAAKARELQLHEALTLGKGEEKTGGREKPSILAAVYEAVMGAIFLESGYQQVRDVVAVHFRDGIDQVERLETTDAKTELQELCQQRYRITPAYRTVEEAGPDHARRFVVEVLFGDTVLAQGEGGSRRSAEQDAARRALQRPIERV
ncbi:MAG: ribonuclease III [Candidatus Binatia bacterium]